MSKPHYKIVLVSDLSPDDIEVKDGKPVIKNFDAAHFDAMDQFNHPRQRRARILHAFESKYAGSVTFEAPPLHEPKGDDILGAYESVHTQGLLTFFNTAWEQWCQLGEHGRDPIASLKSNEHPSSSRDETVPPLIPINMPLPREARERPSQSVMGQIGYYCTDIFTPVFSTLLDELKADAAIIRHALDLCHLNNVVYAMPNHPGHHAASDSFGGYCYLNQVAYAATVLRNEQHHAKVAILDVDYHCGNGTASIFQNDPNVLVISIHCHPDYDYPFHSGFEDENETALALCHIPLLPGATWQENYKPALEKAMQKIEDFGATALIVSLGLDTLKDDPVTLRRAGFCLEGTDYWEMGKLIGRKMKPNAPCLFVQEGGYFLEKLGEAAADVVAGCASERCTS